jgi:hypothetical protein
LKYHVVPRAEAGFTAQQVAALVPLPVAALVDKM